MAVISRPKGAEVVVMKERYRADGAGRYSAPPCGAEWAEHPGNPPFPSARDRGDTELRTGAHGPFEIKGLIFLPFAFFLGEPTAVEVRRTISVQPPTSW